MTLFLEKRTVNLQMLLKKFLTKSPAANIALAKAGAGHRYFSCNSLSALVWGLTLSK
jgi:hypothetical protein